jgi:hypothetical protein
MICKFLAAMDHGTTVLTVSGPTADELSHDDPA